MKMMTRIRVKVKTDDEGDDELVLLVDLRVRKDGRRDLGHVVLVAVT